MCCGKHGPGDWQMIDDGAADRKSKGADEAKNALKNLLRSGIPGIENMFAGPGDNQQKPMKKVRPCTKSIFPNVHDFIYFDFFPGWQGWRHEAVEKGLPQDD